MAHFCYSILIHKKDSDFLLTLSKKLKFKLHLPGYTEDCACLCNNSEKTLKHEQPQASNKYPDFAIAVRDRFSLWLPLIWTYDCNADQD